MCVTLHACLGTELPISTESALFVSKGVDDDSADRAGIRFALGRAC